MKERLFAIKLKYSPVYWIVVVLLSPAFFYFVAEVLNEHYPWHVKIVSFVFNYLIYAGFIALGYAVFGKLRRGLTFAAVLTLVIGVINHYVRMYRNAPLTLFDLQATNTFLSVARQGFDLRPDWIIIVSVIGVIVYYIVIRLSQRYIPLRCVAEKKKRITIRLSCLAGFVLLWCSIFFGDVLRASGIDSSIFNAPEWNGFFVHLITSYQDAKVEPPEGYTAEKAGEILSLYELPDNDVTLKPNIIVIMNEAFADPGIYGDYSTDQPIMPCFERLRKEGVSGYTLASVFGGGTCNSEWEFLTGNSMYFLPGQSIPFQNYLDKKQPSIAWYLKSEGYYCSAFHPNYGEAWEREKAWMFCGFERTVFLEEFPDDGIINERVSDLADYKKMMECFDELRENNPDTPQFLFNVTIQNHVGGYANVPGELGYRIHLEGEGDWGEDYVDGYLTLLHESDLALEWLVEDLKKRDEPFLLLFFGDHQVGLEDSTIQMLKGNRERGLPEEEEIPYLTPFLIWANYDLPFGCDELLVKPEVSSLMLKDVMFTSMNYLPMLVLREAGLPGTAWHRFLRDAYKEVPAINAVGFFSASEGFQQSGGESEPDVLKSYRWLQYNNIFDDTEREERYYE